MRPRIALNMLWSVPGVGGSEEYLVRQLLGLASVGAAVDVDVFAPRGFAARRPDVSSRFTVHEAPSAASRRAVRVALEHSWLAARTRSFDLVHHGGGTVPRIGCGPTVLTLHDVQWTDYPEYVSAVKMRYLRVMVPASLARATRIAVPSSFVAGTLVREFGVAPERIGVVRHGLEATMESDVTSESDVRAKFSLGPGPVLVYPANTHPHKNHRFLLDLLALGRGEWGDEALRLVFAGSPGRAEQQVRDAVRDLGLAHRVVMPGRVSDADRNGLLALADAMVFPSQYEGFGAPVIEAMRFGVPVVCSDRASLPEVAGDAALVVPLEESHWTGVIGQVRRERTRLVAAGRERAELFTAEKSADDLLALYDAALGGGQ